MSNVRQSWSDDLPLDVAMLVLGHLRSYGDRIRFSAVCSSWRVAVKSTPPSPLPLLVLPNGNAYCIPSGEPERLPHCAGYDDAGGNRLVFRSEEDDFQLVDPFSGGKDAVTTTLPASDRARFRHAGYRPEKIVREASEKLDIYSLMSCSVHLVVAVVTYRRGARIAVCQPGATSWWSVLCFSGEWVLPRWYADTAFHADKLYTVACNPEGALYSLEIATDENGNPWVSRVRLVIPPGLFQCQPERSGDNIAIKKVYLVGSSRRCGGDEDLLMVLKTTYGVVKASGGVEADGRRYAFQVFRADLERSRWTRVATLGDDRVLFLRRRCCRLVRTSQIDLPGDSIVFIENGNEDDFSYDKDTLLQNWFIPTSPHP